VLQEAIIEELKPTIIYPGNFLKDVNGLTRLASGLPEHKDLTSTVLAGLVTVLLSPPLEGASVGETIHSSGLSALYNTLASLELDDQVRDPFLPYPRPLALVYIRSLALHITMYILSLSGGSQVNVLIDKIVGHPKYSARDMLLPTLYSITGVTPHGRPSYDMFGFPSTLGMYYDIPQGILGDPADRRYPHIGRIAEAALASVGIGAQVGRIRRDVLARCCLYVDCGDVALQVPPTDGRIHPEEFFRMYQSFLRIDSNVCSICESNPYALSCCRADAW
jgi:hypothetical protein